MSNRNASDDWTTDALLTDDEWLDRRRQKQERRLGALNFPNEGVSPYGKVSTRQAMTAITQLGRVVYAVTIEDRMIKIGYTGNLYDRWMKYGGNAKSVRLLAFTYGSWDLEQDIHAALVPHRALRFEYYHPVPEVLSLINEWRRTLGRGELTVDNWLNP